MKVIGAKANLRHVRRLAVSLLVSGAFLAYQAAPAFADTATATAEAANVTLLGGSVVHSGTVSADNDGTQATVTNSASPALSVLSPQTLITAGALVESAQANNDGSSAACAGLVGAGGTIAINGTGGCTATLGATVTLALTATASLQASAIVESCTASSDGTTSAQDQLVNARVVNTVLGVSTVLATLSATPGANTGLTVPPVVTLGMNNQSVSSGRITASALNLSLLGSAVTAVIGSVTCGTNIHVVPTSALPTLGWPLAAALLGLATWRGVRRYGTRVRALVAR